MKIFFSKIVYSRELFLQKSCIVDLRLSSAYASVIEVSEAVFEIRYKTKNAIWSVQNFF